MAVVRYTVFSFSIAVVRYGVDLMKEAMGLVDSGLRESAVRYADVVGKEGILY